MNPAPTDWPVKYFDAKERLMDTTERLRQTQFDLIDHRTLVRHLAYSLFCSGVDANKVLEGFDLVFLADKPTFNPPTRLPEEPDAFRQRYAFTSWETIGPTQPTPPTLTRADATLGDESEDDENTLPPLEEMVKANSTLKDEQ